MEKKKKSLRRRLFKGFLIFLALHAAYSLVFSVYACSTQRPAAFKGSPPSAYAPRQRNDLDFSEHGTWFGRWNKTFRPSGYWEIGPSGVLGPLIHRISGWDVFKDDACVEGVIASLGMADDDGDVGMTLDLPPDLRKYAFRPDDPFDAGMHKRLIVEVDEFLRVNFPVVTDLAVGDTLRVCGRWVYDRGHDHCEIHPARWIEILQEGPERPRDPPRP